MILLDTSVWIDALRGTQTPEVLRFRKAIEADETICICGLVLTEVLQGMKSEEDAQAFRDAVGSYVYLTMRRTTYLLAARIARAARARGKAVRSAIDCLIAACAIVNGVSLLQKDRDFQTIAEVSDLRLERA